MKKKCNPPIQGSILEGLSKIVGDSSNGITGPGIVKFLSGEKVSDVSPEASNWTLIYNAWVDFQNKNQQSYNILAFIQKAMHPARFIDTSMPRNENIAAAITHEHIQELPVCFLMSVK